MAQEKILGNQLNLTDVTAELNPLLTTDLVTDLTPQLGGDLDTNGYSIIGADTSVAPVGSPAPTGGEVNIVSGSSTYAGAGSFAGKLILKGGSRQTYAGDYSGVAHPTDFTSVNIRGGDGAGYAGDVLIEGGDSAAYWGEGGNVILRGGNSQHATNNGPTGQVELYTANSATGASGNILLTTGTAAGTSNPGDIRLVAGASTGAQKGGDIYLTTGDGGTAKSGGIILIQLGSGDTGIANGEIRVQNGHMSMVGNQIHQVSHVMNSLFNNNTATNIEWDRDSYQTITPAGSPPTAYTFSWTDYNTGSTTLHLAVTNGAGATLTWPATVKWIGGVEPTWTAGKDIITFFFDGTDYNAVNVALGLA